MLQENSASCKRYLNLLLPKQAILSIGFPARPAAGYCQPGKTRYDSYVREYCGHAVPFLLENSKPESTGAIAFQIYSGTTQTNQISISLSPACG